VALPPGPRTPGSVNLIRFALYPLQTLLYLDAVVKETLRLRPAIDAAERTLTKPRMIAGWELPAGVEVYPAFASAA
jgi:cytochrome P450